MPIALIFGLVLLWSLHGDAGDTIAVESSPLETWLKVIVGHLVAGAEIAAAVVVGEAVVRGIFASDTQPVELPAHSSWDEWQALSKPQP